MKRTPDFERLKKLDRIATRMDTAFRLPGTGIRVGWDSILGLIPGIGDAAAMAPAAYVVLESHRMGLPRHKLVRQGVNVGIDTLVGSIPLIGDLFDVGFKANRKNVAILRAHMEAEQARLDKEAEALGEGRLASHHPSIEGKTTA